MIFSTLLVLFIAMPILELMVLLRVLTAAGWVNTLGLVVFTGVLGAALARAQGLIVVAQIQRDMAEGRMPAPRLMDGVMILIAGVLLITPGLITDSVGFMLLIPAIRSAIRAWMRSKIEEKLRNGTCTMDFGSRG